MHPAILRFGSYRNEAEIGEIITGAFANSWSVPFDIEFGFRNALRYGSKLQLSVKVP